MSRIVRGDSSGDVVIKLSDNHSGAAAVMVALMKEGESIDPGSEDGKIHQVKMLDKCGIYGERIWRLYKTLCQEDLVTMCALLRAVELEFLNCQELNKAISLVGYWTQEQVETCVRNVRDTQSTFKQT